MSVSVRVSIFALAALLVGCATNIKPTVAFNPQPSEAFRNFDRFELAKLELPASYDNAANQRATVKIEENLQKGLTPRFEEWQGKGTTRGRSLRIEPRIEEIKFVSVGSRIMVGAMAGSSAVRIKVAFRDAGSGGLIAEPEFYRSANAFTSTYGVQDNLMLNSIAEAIVQYTLNNYTAPVGGAVTAP
jgi:hypothetical protein